MEIERLFWSIARRYTTCDYVDNLEALRLCSQGAYDSLPKTNSKTRSRAFFMVGSYCNDNLNNLYESFNRTICEAIRKPLLDFLEDIRRQCMVKIARRSIMARMLHTRFTKSAHKQLDVAVQKSRKCARYMSTGDMHEIGVHDCSYRVNMRLRICGCVKWQLNGVPCEHVASVIIGQKQNLEDYVSEFFSTRIWQKTYENGIQPVEGKKLWPRVNKLLVLPPPNRVGKAGRPSKYVMHKGQNEAAANAANTRLNRKNGVMTCSNCKEEGHNKSSCTTATQVIAPIAKRPRRRPRKVVDSSSQAGCSQGVGSQDGCSQGGISSIQGSQV